MSLKATWTRLVTFNRTRLVPNLLKMPDQEFAVAQNQTFERAKRVSDFVGMIVRLAFLMFAFMYFLGAAPKAEGIMGFALGMCAVSCFGLLYVLGREIFMIVFLWEVSEARKTPAGIGRNILFLSAIFLTVCIYLAIYELVGSIAQSNALLAST